MESGQVEAGLFEIRDQRSKLRYFIADQIKKSQKSVSFKLIAERVKEQYKESFNDEFVMKAIDELFQRGIIYETSKCMYHHIDNELMGQDDV